MRFFLKREKFEIKKYRTIFESVLIKFFQIQYHPFIATFFVPSKNTGNKFTFIWCNVNNN